MDAFRRGTFQFPVADGGPGGGETAVLLHGFPQDNSAWDTISPLLHEAGLRTLAPDQRGYAHTATPKRRRDYGLDELALDVIALLDEAGLTKVHIVGHDWGGAVAWHLASRHADRVSTVTVISTPHPAALSWSMLRSNQALMSYYMALFQLPLLPERLLAPRLYRFYRGSGLPKEHAKRYAKRFSAPGSLTGPLQWYRAIPLSRVKTGRSLVPTTYVWGRDDAALGRVGAQRTSHYVNATYRYLEVEGGHWLPETHPRLVADEVIRRAKGY